MLYYKFVIYCVKHLHGAEKNVFDDSCIILLFYCLNGCKL